MNNETNDYQVTHTTGYSLGKSEITDEYCRRIIELYKISIILTKSFACSNAEAFENLFLIKCVELEKFCQKQIQTISNLDNNQLDSYLKRVIEFANKVRNGLSNPKEIEVYTNIINKLESLSLESFKNLIISIFYRENILGDHNIDKLHQIVSSIDQTQIETALSLDVNTELQRLVELNLFKNYGSRNNDSTILDTVRYIENNGAYTGVFDYACDIIYDKLSALSNVFSEDNSSKKI